MPKHITKEQKKAIIEFYKLKPITIQELATQFGISCPSAIKILKEYRIKPYAKNQLFSPNLKEDYFEILDSEAKAYFLGLILTDGCVHMTKGKQPLVGLCLQEKDKYILERFKVELCSNKKITSDGRGCCGININSRRLVESLKQYGIFPNKSLNTTFPKNIPKHLYPHFIRGLIDGDGSISFYARPNKKAHVKAIRLCQGNQQFLKDFVSFLHENYEIEPISVYQEKECLWSIAYRKNASMLKLIDILYNNSHIYMSRKKELCNLIRQEIVGYGNTEITKRNNKLLES